MNQKIETNDWIKYFPYDQTRVAQEKVINKVLNDFLNKNKKYAIIDCGTGVGKSAIGLTIANFINENSSSFEGKYEDGSYFLTTQKVLQDQYEKDFSNKGLVSLYSASNYSCSIDSKASCKDILTGIRSKSLPAKFDCCGYECKYKKKKKNFVDNKLGVTNFSYFLTEKNYSKKMPNKKVLIVDEAHNLENELTRFVEINISGYFSDKILGLKVPKDLTTQFKVYNWIRNVYYPKLISKINFIKSQLEKFGLNSSKIEELKKITNRLEMLTSHETKILQFITLYNKDNWIFDVEKTNEKYRKFIFKPIDVSRYAHEYLLSMADFVIFMSATIINHEGFSLTLGLPSEEVSIVSVPSPFSSENRPIIFSSAGSMSSKNIEKTLPVMTQMVKEILNNHKKEKGIIHTHSTKVAEHLKRTIRNKRIIVAYGANREESLQKHIKSKEPTVLISPSMAEGVDLKGDLSNFQVICKVPFPYLGDKVVVKKMNRWKWWYNTQTVRTIIQAVGRSIRSEDDTAVTYILDGDWNRIKSSCRDYFPENFFENYHEM